MITKTKLGDVSKLSIGFVGTVTSQYEDNGVPFFRTVNIKPYSIDNSDLKTINYEFHQSQKKSQLNKDDVAMVHTGVPGICCVIPEEYDDSNCIDMIVIKPDKNQLDSFYLEAYMNSVGYKHIQKQQVGANQKHFNLNDAIDLDIFIPDISIQKKIGTFSKTINKKININEKINRELINSIRLIFNYWFLQFDFPNENNLPYSSSGGELVWNNELNQSIPKGWIVDNFGSGLSSNIIKTGITKFNNNKIYIATADVTDFNITNDSNFITFKKKPSRANMQPIKRSIWFAKMIGSRKVVLVGDYSDKLINNYIFSTGFCGIECLENYFYYLSSFVINENFEKIKNHLCAGSTMQAVKNDNVKLIKYVLPNEAILIKFNKIVEPMFKIIYQNNIENNNLIKFRDFILPLLINGQVKFKD